jgi:hypothetical protein
MSTKMSTYHTFGLTARSYNNLYILWVVGNEKVGESQVCDRLSEGNQPEVIFHSPLLAVTFTTQQINS